MAMKKAEMEAHQTQYYVLLAEAREARRAGLYRNAIELAMSSWPCIDGMMQFERKHWKKDFASIEAIDIVLRFAPFIFDSGALDNLAVLLKGQKRIDKNASADIADNLSRCRALMWDAHRMWQHLERHPNARQDDLSKNLGGNQDRWRLVAEQWEKMDLVRRTPDRGSYLLALNTDMDQRIFAKCSSCGAVAKARKTKFLAAIDCPKCRATTLFVILAQTAPDPRTG